MKFQWKLSSLAVAICVGFYIVEIAWNAKWKNENEVIQTDVIGYYAYLPATFIYKDLSFDFVGKYQGDKEYSIWVDTLPNGKRYLRYSVGQAVLYSPFFLLGHSAANIFGYNTGGYSEPYKFFLLLSCLFYIVWGFLALRKLLCRYFPDYAVAITLVLICFSTNLYHYVTNETTMTHAYSFSLIAIFLLLTDNWFRKPNMKLSLLIGLVFGLLSLVRVFNSLILIFFVLYGVESLQGLKDRSRFFISKYYYILTMAVVCFIIWIPQFLYWKFVSGHFIFYSYDLSGGKFFFNHPKIIQGLFSYRKGWFVYNPIMLFIIPGVFFVHKYFKGFRIAFLVFFPIFIYSLFSWWSWWYGGGFSIRSMVDIYAIYAFPLTAAIAEIIRSRSKIIKFGLSFLMTFFLVTGFIFNRQYRKGIIHYDGMTKEAFWTSFYKLKVTPAYLDLICRPDYDLARKGIYICTHDLGKYRDAEIQPREKF